MKFLLKASITLVIFLSISFITFDVAYGDIKPLPKYYLGKKDAPVTVYEFMSLSCYYCADNINLFMPPNNKDNALSKAIKEGKIKLVIIDIPIHKNIDLLTHTILYYSKNNDQYFKLVKLFINNQNKLISSKDPTSMIINYAKIAEMNDNTIEKYKKDITTPKIIYNNADYYVKKYNLVGTPTTIVEKTGKPITKNSYSKVGLCNIEELENTINNLLNEKPKV